MPQLLDEQMSLEAVTKISEWQWWVANWCR